MVEVNVVIVVVIIVVVVVVTVSVVVVIVVVVVVVGVADDVSLVEVVVGSCWSKFVGVIFVAVLVAVVD